MALPASGVMGDTDPGYTNDEFAVDIESTRDFISNLPGGGPRVELTIASGSVTPGVRDHGGRFTIDTEGDASTDTLNTITYTNMPDGSIIRLYAENAARVVTLEDSNGGSGEMLMVDGADFVFNNLSQWIEFERRTSSWVETARHYGTQSEIAAATALTALDDSADLLSIYDDSAAANKKITIANARAGLALPRACGFSATPASNQSGIANVTWTDVAFATEAFDAGGNFSTPSFTAPADGLYLFSWTVATATVLGAGDVLQTRLLKNGTGNGVAGARDVLGNSTAGVLSASAVLYLSAGDTIKVQLYHNLGSNVTLDYAGAIGGAGMHFGGARLA